MEKQLKLSTDASGPASGPLLIPEVGWGIHLLDEFFGAMDELDDHSKVAFSDWRYLSASASHAVVEAHRTIQRLKPSDGYELLMLMKRQFATLTKATREGAAADALKTQIHDLAAQIESMSR